MCLSAGIGGNKTNHSLRATAATRLFHKGIDEQLIQEVTGHKSVAVQNYKHTSTEQKQAMSDVLYLNSSKKPRLEPTVTCAKNPENESNVPIIQTNILNVNINLTKLQVIPDKIVINPIVNVPKHQLSLIQGTGQIYKLPKIVVNLNINVVDI